MCLATLLALKRMKSLRGEVKLNNPTRLKRIDVAAAASGRKK
jgi:hypothetical protein